MSFLKKIFEVTESKKWKIFGIQTDVEWYDVKTKFKQLLRKITYSWLFQEFICTIALVYLKFVFHSSKKIFLNTEVCVNEIKQGKPVIISFWHNRLLMIPFIAMNAKKSVPSHEFMTLASKHGDGKFVGVTMQKLGMVSILGSSKDGRKSSRGIDIGSFKRIFTGFKNGQSLGMTPDGPRGPSQKINGELVNIARISGAAILPTSYSASRHKKLRTWDRLMIPLPFSKLVFAFDDAVIRVDKNANEEEIKKLIVFTESRMNDIQDKADKLVNSK